MDITLNEVERLKGGRLRLKYAVDGHALSADFAGFDDLRAWAQAAGDMEAVARDLALRRAVAAALFPEGEKPAEEKVLAKPVSYRVEPSRVEVSR